MSDDPKGFFVSLPNLSRYGSQTAPMRGISFQLKTDGVRYFHVQDHLRTKREVRDISTQYRALSYYGRGSRMWLGERETELAHERLIDHARRFYPEFVVPWHRSNEPYSWVAFPMLGAAMKDSTRRAPEGVNLQVASGLRALSVQDMTARIFGEAPKQLQAAVAQSLSSNRDIVNIDNLTLASLLRGYLPPNEMVEVLRVDLRNDGQFQQMDKHSANAIRLLLRRFNSKRLMRIVMSLQQHPRGDMLLRDTAIQYAGARQTHPDVIMDLSRQFRSMEELHECVTREYRKLANANQEIVYYDEHLIGSDHIELEGGAKLIWPGCTHDLLDWANTMNNCIYSYGKTAAANRCLLLAVLDASGKMIINIMIQGKRVSQCYGPANSYVETPDLLVSIFEKLVDMDIINAEEDPFTWLGRRRWQI
jgi:hypothetical protein